jgi:Fic family protein
MMEETGNMTFESFKASLESFKAMNIREAIDYEKWNNMFITHHSTSIEGSSLTVDETRMLLSKGITAEGKPLIDHLMVTNYHAALLEIIEYAKNKGEITPEHIRHIAASVMKDTGGVVHAMGGSFDISKGDFRLGMVFVGKRYFMDFRKVPDAVKNLCGQINARMDSISGIKEIYNAAFDAHFEFVSIHPLGDGNGRVARLLMNYILEYHKQPLALIFSEDKANYFKALEKAREKESHTPFRNFMYTQQTKFFEQEIAKLNRGTKWTFRR